MSPPSLIFGTATVGESFYDVEQTKALLNHLNGYGQLVKRLDTARRYPKDRPHFSEKLLGEAGAETRGFVIDTKLDLPQAMIDGRGTLTKERIDESVEGSLSALTVARVNVLYCHRPDELTPVKKTAAALDQQYRNGHFKKLGLSNYSLDQIKEFYDICENEGYVKPTVFQGQYNPLWRGAEQELFPFLRANGIAFTAYSPLAGGFLSGKMTAGSDLSGTRFAEGNSMGTSYRRMYDKSNTHAAVLHLQDAIQPHGLSLPEVSLRWLYHHSELGHDDGIILGASKISQLESNARDIQKGPLPESVLVTLDQAWEIARKDPQNT